MRRLVVAAVAALLVAGCGDDEFESTGPAPERPAAGGGGELGWALAGLAPDLDPLGASTRTAQLVTRQAHEPLFDRLTPPYDNKPERVGLALSIRPSPDRSIWRAELRDGVRFHDGTPFNAAAVLANARRWTTLPAGRELLPTLFAVDAPRPDIVRFVLDQPTAGFPRQLSSPRLGLVSPEALRPRSGEGAEVVGNVGGPGTGAFAISQIGDGRIALARNAAWWGTPLGFGPALDVVEFRAAAAEPERLRLLQSGEVQVAEGLSKPTLASIAGDPLLTALPGAGIGLQRSVRGIDSATPIPLSGVWLTTVAQP